MPFKNGKPSSCSPWNKGKKCPQYSGEKHWNYGKHWDDKHKKMMRDSMKGFTHTIEAKRKMSKNHSDVSGNKNPMYKNGKKIHSGYILILQPNHPFCNSSRYVPEHRLVMEKHIGRYLKPTEVVHHRNGVRGDNRIKNLKLFIDKSHHSKHHYKLGAFSCSHRSSQSLSV